MDDDEPAEPPRQRARCQLESYEVVADIVEIVWYADC